MNCINVIQHHVEYVYVEALDKPVFSNRQARFLTGNCRVNNCNIGRLSHYTLFEGGAGGGDGAAGEVPEPATVALFGPGLSGIAASRSKARRARKA
jgi:hypothetical protein